MFPDSPAADALEGASLTISSDTVDNRDSVVVIGTGFPPGETMQLAQCAGAGVVGWAMEEWCDLTTGEVVTTDHEGRFSASLQLRTVTSVGGRIEHACPEVGCSVGAGRRADVEASVAITWTPTASIEPAPHLTLTKLELDGESNTGTVAVRGTGFAPGSVVQLDQCPLAAAGNGVDAGDCLYEYGDAATADDQGEFSVSMVVYPRFQRSNDELIDCQETPQVCTVAVPWPQDPRERISWATFAEASE